MAETKISLKLQVDVKANKVVFAEAGKDFVDFIFTLMKLPLSTVSKLLNNEKLGMVGCLGELYKSIESLDSEYYDSKLIKDSLLKQRDDITVPLFSLNTAPKPSNETLIKYYKCSRHTECVTDGKGTLCALCYSPMTSSEFSLSYVSPKRDLKYGYVKKSVSYMVMDNLEIKPMSLSLIRSIVKDFNSLEEKQVDFGLHEGLALLKASMEDKAVLTGVFLRKKI